MFKRYLVLGALTTLTMLHISCEDSIAEPEEATQLTTKALINGCSLSNKSACAYKPLQIKPVHLPHMTTSLSYTDYAGQQRTFQVEVRRPQNPQAPTPVVIWSHGGPTGQNNPSLVGEEWGEVFNRAGYVSVHIAHSNRPKSKTLALCSSLWVGGCSVACTQNSQCTQYSEPFCDPEDHQCRYFKDPNWDRPADLERLLTWLNVQNGPGGSFQGLLDLDKIAYAGHSSGGSAAMMAAGATRFYGDPNWQHSKINSQIKAFISTSPQPPGESGFVTGSFDGTLCSALAADPSLCFSRPHLLLTGRGDDTNATTAEDRLIPFALMPAGEKFFAWIDDEAAVHRTFNHQSSDCASFAQANGLDPARCDDHLIWMDSMVLAFLDAYLRGSVGAQSWLRSGNIKLLSGSVMIVSER